MSNHTPGPWKVEPIHRDRVVAGNFRFLPANDRGAPMEEWQANARLIAAAPDLLDLAKNIAGLDPVYIPAGNSILAVAVREWFTQARAAIAKAEGAS